MQHGQDVQALRRMVVNVPHTQQARILEQGGGGSGRRGIRWRTLASPRTGPTTGPGSTFSSSRCPCHRRVGAQQFIGPRDRKARRCELPLGHERRVRRELYGGLGGLFWKLGRRCGRAAAINRDVPSEILFQQCLANLRR